MTAYVHVNLRIKDPARQAALAPRFQAALQAAGGRILHFGPVAQMLEGDVAPLPMAGIFEFATLADALAFYQSSEYAPIKVERDAAQEARMFVVDAGSRPPRSRSWERGELVLTVVMRLGGLRRVNTVTPSPDVLLLNCLPDRGGDPGHPRIGLPTAGPARS